MADFDFDELDKAVNSAIGTPEPAPQEPTPTPEVSRSEPEPISRPVPSQPAPAMRRSGGRFMDVVHPSSDMRTRSTVEVPSRAPEPAPVEQNIADPLDDTDWKTPLDSPFLPDAQVEKRPLGASVPTGESLRAADADLMLEEPDELRLEAPDELQLEAPEEATQDDRHIMPDPIDFATSTTDVEEVAEPAVPATKPISDQVSDADLSQAAALDAETFPVVKTAEVVDTPVVAAEPQVPEAPEVPAGPVSITQQYKEKPAEVAEPGAIYDTENYHQPITAPVKKKSGAWVILWILLILLVGGGAGAAFYFFVLPTL